MLKKKQNIYSKIIFLFFYGTGIIACEGHLQDHNRYNILFIAIDDLNTELGVYDKEYVNTPNIDEFASQGVTFKKHYVQAVSCGPSRYALLTGRSPSNSGVSANNQALYEGESAMVHQLLDGAQSMPELFERSGYHTVNIGKISHTPDGKAYNYDGTGDGHPELPNAWDEFATPYGQWERGWGTFFAYANGKHREDGRDNEDLMEFVVERDDDLPDGMMASTAIEKLKELKNRDEPFFLGLGFFKPHLPFVAPRKDWEAVQHWDIPPANNPDRIDTPYWNNSGEFYRYEMHFPKTRPLGPEDRMKVRRAYMASVRYVDRQVGRVLDALEQEGMADETIVVVWSDHGWYLGEFEMWGKHTLFERASHSPLIIRAPDIKEPGRKSNALVQAIDLYPTLVELTNPAFQKTHHPLDGISLVPVLNNETDFIRDGSLTFWRNAVSVRSQDYRLISTWSNEDQSWTDTELYNMSMAPDPATDISDENTEIVEEMEKMLKIHHNNSGK
ncbi:sulfatase [Rhodohalobacter sulfatireducens]|uniref:Sulfatase n=1 Tax=Rhodohalobacter sulfatireducens TaxID=2911366 RepID=A0ABS9KJ48_9BACT|nr:sulfatase [Rhodohalobacter sulfatireducens]MCG2590882.1 sulfatase [Rhodohalobacter sulfatireducens]